MEDRIYKISWRYKIVALTGTCFFCLALFATFYRYEIEYYWGESWFNFVIILVMVAIISTIYFFAYKIIISDDFISKRQFFVCQKIYFKEIKSIDSSGLYGHIKKIKSNKTTIRIAINDTLNNQSLLKVEIERLKLQYAVIPLGSAVVTDTDFKQSPSR